MLEPLSSARGKGLRGKSSSGGMSAYKHPACRPSSRTSFEDPKPSTSKTSGGAPSLTDAAQNPPNLSRNSYRGAVEGVPGLLERHSQGLSMAPPDDRGVSHSLSPLPLRLTSIARPSRRRRRPLSTRRSNPSSQRRPSIQSTRRPQVRSPISSWCPRRTAV